MSPAGQPGGATAGPPGTAGAPGTAGPPGTAGQLGAGTPGTVGPAPLSRDWLAPFPVDVVLALSVHRRGHGDPAFRTDNAGAVWRTSLTPAGPGTLRLTAPRPGPAATPAATPVSAMAWGPGAGWLLDALPVMLGSLDHPESFSPAHPLLREVARRRGAVRVGRSGRVLEALVAAILEQKVVGQEAWRAWRLLLTRFGQPAPGPAPAGMRVFPPPHVWRTMPSWEWHRVGVEGVRAATVAGAAMVAGRLEEIVAMPSADADRRLRALPGIGPWTSAEVRQRACGDADAVSVGDYHLPAFVGWALAGRKTDDAGMLELLAPYAGHRYRATRLVELSGVRPPRRGPRMAVRDYRSF